jgi:hypothetical protein
MTTEHLLDLSFTSHFRRIYEHTRSIAVINHCTAWPMHHDKLCCDEIYMHMVMTINVEYVKIAPDFIFPLHHDRS